MTKEKIVALLLVLALVGLVWWLMTKEPTELSPKVTEAELARFADAAKVEFRNETGDMVTVEYVGDLARINGGEYNGMILRQVVAASGAKYEGDGGVTLWTKGEEVRIETPQTVVYTGVAANDVVEPTVPNPEIVDVASTTSTAPLFTDVKWVWTKAVVKGEEIKPKKSGAFTLTFGADGRASGETDCNGFGGEYTLTDKEIGFGDFMSTLMYCDGSEEATFTGLLGKSVKIIEQTEDSLLLENTNSDQIFFVK